MVIDAPTPFNLLNSTPMNLKVALYNYDTKERAIVTEYVVGTPMHAESPFISNYSISNGILNVDLVTSWAHAEDMNATGSLISIMFYYYFPSDNIRRVTKKVLPRALCLIQK